MTGRSRGNGTNGNMGISIWMSGNFFFPLWEWLSRSTGCLGGCRVSICRDTQKPSGHGQLALGGPTWAEVWTRWTPTVSVSLSHLWFCELLHHLNDTVKHHPENTAGRPRQGWEYSAFTLFNTYRSRRNPGIFDHSIHKKVYFNVPKTKTFLHLVLTEKASTFLLSGSSHSTFNICKPLTSGPQQPCLFSPVPQHKPPHFSEAHNHFEPHQCHLFSKENGYPISWYTQSLLSCRKWLNTGSAV